MAEKKKSYYQALNEAISAANGFGSDDLEDIDDDFSLIDQFDAEMAGMYYGGYDPTLEPDVE